MNFKYSTRVEKAKIACKVLDEKQVKNGEVSGVCSTHGLKGKFIQNVDRISSYKKANVWERKA